MIAQVAAAGAPVALVTCGLLLLSLAGAWLRLLPPLAAFALFSLTLLLGGALSVVAGAIGLWRGAPDGGGSGGALFAAVVGVTCMALVGWRLVAAGDIPAIHDVTTDVADPPAFVAARLLDANDGRDLDYPNGAVDTPQLQQQAYADVGPIALDAAPADAYVAAVEVARAFGWDVYRDDPAAGIFEAEVETSIFHFVDDVVVRVRGLNGGSVVDVRSTSRVGVGDMGANAARIRAFRAALQAR